jgi:hypothetical protein
MRQPHSVIFAVYRAHEAELITDIDGTPTPSGIAAEAHILRWIQVRGSSPALRPPWPQVVICAACFSASVIST